MKRFVRTSVTGTGQEDDSRRPDLGGLEDDENVHYSMYDEEPDDSVCMARVTAPAEKMKEIERVGEVTVIDDEDARKVLKKHTPHADLENLDQPDVEVDEMINRQDPEQVLSEEKQLRVRIIQEWTQEVPREKRHELLEQANARNVGGLVHRMSEEKLREIVEQHDLTEIGDLHHDTSVIVRSAVALPSRGNQVLQDQEFHAIKKVAEAKQVQRVDYIPDDGHVLAKAEAENRDNTPEELKKRVKAIIDGRNAEHQEMVDWMKDRGEPDWVHRI
ncbi:MAG: hypothetical protein SVV03_00900 [Candidatus Nanohaloarchaea archaeon]|nr:hypothetical protein [Candidatus Nanohaloarchaea archaeon]